MIKLIILLILEEFLLAAHVYRMRYRRRGSIQNSIDILIKNFLIIASIITSAAIGYLCLSAILGVIIAIIIGIAIPVIIAFLIIVILNLIF